MQVLLILGLSLVLQALAATDDDVLKEEVVTPQLQASQANSSESNTLYICSGNHCEYDDCTKLPNHNENGDAVIACPLSSKASCSCGANMCSCCVHFKQDAHNINNDLCVELVYNEATESIIENLKWNHVLFFSDSFLRPPKEPFCTALPIPNIEVCAGVTDFSFSGGSPHFCAKISLKIYEKPVLVLTLGCFKVIPASGSLLVPADVEDHVDVNSYTAPYIHHELFEDY